jgi:thiosulfate/3-mercaptopyruvate sulfurtransferase
MLIDAATLTRHLSDPSWVVFDCRHDLARPERGVQLYAEGHVPGAHFASVDRDLSGPKTGTNGRHPLPAPAAFAAFLAGHGVSAATTVIAYDDVGGQYAARLWWMLRWIGHQRAALLDGGFPKWLADGRPLSREVPSPTPATLTAAPDTAQLCDAAQIHARLGDPAFAVLDARAAERYRAETEPIDPVAGHIPGALNRFYKLNLNADLTLRPAAELRAEFTALLASRRPADIAHQCGSGITACANLFAMEYAGLSGSKLYAGSWSEWIADPARPTVPPRRN